MSQLEVTVRGCGAYPDTIIQYLLSSFKVYLGTLKVRSKKQILLPLVDCDAKEAQKCN